MTAPTRRKRAEPEPEQDPAEGQVCGRCWPHGWPTPDTTAASCEHGQWTR